MTAAMKLKTLASWKESYDKLRHPIKKQRQYFANTGSSITLPTKVYIVKDFTAFPGISMDMKVGV